MTPHTALGLTRDDEGLEKLHGLQGFSYVRKHLLSTQELLCIRGWSCVSRTRARRKLEKVDEVQRSFQGCAPKSSPPSHSFDGNTAMTQWSVTISLPDMGRQRQFVFRPGKYVRIAFHSRDNKIQHSGLILRRRCRVLCQ
jgi:hypothetical protein